MRLDIQSAVALRHRGRRAFGTARWIEGQRLAFTTYGDVTVGDRLEMRLELTGAYDSVWAEVLIETARPIGVGGPQLCTGEIAYIPEDDRDRLELWVEERSVSQLSLQAHKAEDRDASQSAEADSAASKAGRKAVSAALRRSIQRKAEVVPRSWAALQLSRDGTLLSAAWSTWQGLGADWSRQLSKSLLRVDTTLQTPPRGYALTVRLCLPDGQVLAVQGRVTDTDSAGMLLALDLSPDTRRRLNRASQRL